MTTGKLELSKTLRDFFQSSYQLAVTQTIEDAKLDYNDENYRSADVLSIVEHLEMVLNNKKGELTEHDFLILNCFLPSLRNTIKNRKLTNGSTSFVSKLTDCIRYICIWLNAERGYHFDVKLESRRKGLESELTKILYKSLEHVNNLDDELLCTLPPVIRDRFGLRITLAEDNPELLLKLVRIIVTILTNSDSYYFIQFTEWVDTVKDKFGGESVPKNLIFEVLSYTLLLSNVKNYINKPKESTYQSWQATFTVDATSPFLGGLMFELQARTFEMHKNAEYGEASHDKYKDQILLDLKEVFKIQNYSGGIVFYAGPDFPHLDQDGISNPAPILSRHVSPHLIERTSH